MTRAVLFVRSDDINPQTERCAIYATERGYDIVGVVRDDWTVAQRMLDVGQTTVVVVSKQAHLSPDRKPRVEIVEDMRLHEPPESDDPDDSRRRRPRPV